MQALPAANPVTPAVTANVANPQNAEASAAAVAPTGTEQPAPATFEQVLASQLDAEVLRPDLILEAANSEWDEAPDAASELLSLQAQDPSMTVPFLQSAAAPRADAADDVLQAGDLNLDADAIESASAATAGSHAAAARESVAEAGLQELAGLGKHGSGKGLDAETGLRATAPLESGAQSQPLHGPQESQRTLSQVRSAESGHAFNPRSIPEPVKSPQWGEALGQRVVWMAKENVQVVYLQVEPPNLGPLEVQLRLSNDQANLTFSSAHASVRDAISGSLPKLDELLAAGGVSLGSVSVNTQSPSQDPRQNPGGGDAPPRSSDWELDPLTGEASRPAQPLVIGLVDTFA